MDQHFTCTVGGLGTFGGHFASAMDDMVIGAEQVRLAIRFANANETFAAAISKDFEDCTPEEREVRAWVYQQASQVATINRLITTRPSALQGDCFEWPSALRSLVWKEYSEKLLSFFGQYLTLAAADRGTPGAQQPEVLPPVAAQDVSAEPA